VVLDKDAGSWVIADSSVVGYDGARKVRDEELSVGQKKLVRKAEPPSKRGIAWPRWTGFRGKTVWDLMDLLIVPLALVVIGLVFTMLQDARQQEFEAAREQRSQDAEAERARQAQKIEGRRAEAERDLAEQSAQDEALQAYLDQMNQLLLENDLRASDEDSEVRTLARARTLTVLGRLDPSRKTALMQFLVEAELVQRVEGRKPIIELSGADLSGADLSGADLHGANLAEANLNHADLSSVWMDNASLFKANLSHAKLGAAELRHVDLSSANLADADLSVKAGLDYLGKDYVEGPVAAFAPQALFTSANLSGADLSGVNLHKAQLSEANLSHAKLVGTTLSGADLTSADLTEANLTKANLSGASVYPIKDMTNKRLVDTRKLEEQAASLEGATMPDGSKHP
jgi:uncharacterized protein YjbI with pentapeptide repeats